MKYLLIFAVLLCGCGEKPVKDDCDTDYPKVFATVNAEGKLVNLYLSCRRLE